MSSLFFVLETLVEKTCLKFVRVFESSGMCVGDTVCGMQERCSLHPACFCPCHNFDIAHMSEIIGMCLDVDPNFDVDATIGMTREQLMDHVQEPAVFSIRQRERLMDLGERHWRREAAKRGVSSRSQVVMAGVRNFIVPTQTKSKGVQKKRCRLGVCLSSECHAKAKKNASSRLIQRAVASNRKSKGP